ncbi:phosducin-like protein [Halichondria panicea]|uniref:phosducin-like protein n=1 Tax=Halichondria panicea TaxID=6063 RepID=UPI00312B32FE
MASGGSDSDLDFSSAPEDLPSNVPLPEHDGLPQTGPKGVLTDYYRTQQSERRKEILAKNKRQEIIEKHSATVMSHSEETALKQGESEERAMTNLAMALEGGALHEDPFLQDYRAKRMEQMKNEVKKGGRRQRFGNLVEVRGDKYDHYIENSPPQTFVIMHIYDEFVSVCLYLNQRLTQMAKLYPTARFCRVQAGQVGVSPAFISKGLPALLVYRGGDLVGNLLRITDQLGEGYSNEDLEAFLHEKNCLPPESEKEEGALLPKNILGISKKRLSSSDSD